RLPDQHSRFPDQGTRTHVSTNKLIYDPHAFIHSSAADIQRTSRPTTIGIVYWKEHTPPIRGRLLNNSESCKKPLQFLFELGTLCRMTKHFLSICVAIFLMSTAAFAQEIGGATLNGTVSDPSGAAITNAKVTATQTSTGVARMTQTSGAGV